MVRKYKRKYWLTQTVNLWGTKKKRWDIDPKGVPFYAGQYYYLPKYLGEKLVKMGVAVRQEERKITGWRKRKDTKHVFDFVNEDGVHGVTGFYTYTVSMPEGIMRQGWKVRSYDDRPFSARDISGIVPKEVALDIARDYMRSWGG